LPLLAAYFVVSHRDDTQCFAGTLTELSQPPPVRRRFVRGLRGVFAPLQKQVRCLA